MFSGIVECTAEVLALTPGPAGIVLQLAHAPFDAAVRHGDSVAVSGVCLTATTPEPRRCSFDVIPETLRRTTLGALQVGDAVNIERALLPTSRFDGHFVQGHVDATATVERIDRRHDEYVVWMTAPPELVPMIVPKGSIAVDGVSLTIAAAEGQRFSVALIPTTLERTTLGRLATGSRVNLESDIIARTVNHQLARLCGGAAAGDLADVLQRSGFA